MINYKIEKDGNIYIIYKIFNSPFFITQIIGIAFTKYGAKYIMKKDIKKETKNKILIGYYNEHGEEINE